MFKMAVVFICISFCLNEVELCFPKLFKSALCRVNETSFEEIFCHVCILTFVLGFIFQLQIRGLLSVNLLHCNEKELLFAEINFHQK